MIKNQERSSLPSFPAVAAMNKHNGINWLWNPRGQVITQPCLLLRKRAQFPLI